MNGDLLDEIEMNNSPKDCYKRNIHLSHFAFFVVAIMTWGYIKERWIGFLIFGITIFIGAIVNIIIAILDKKGKLY